MQWLRCIDVEACRHLTTTGGYKRGNRYTLFYLEEKESSTVLASGSATWEKAQPDSVHHLVQTKFEAPGDFQIQARQ
jgi:hypothetical protein